MLVFGDRKMTKAMWAKESGIAYKTFHKRLSDGWPLEKAISFPVRKPPPAALAE